MKAQLVIAVLLAICLPLTPADEDENRIRAQLEEMLSWLEITFEELQQSAFNLTIDLSAVASQQQNRIQKLASQLNRQINEQVNDLQEQAQQSGVDANDCFESVPDRLDSVVNNFTNTGIRCLTDKVAEVNDVLTNLVGVLNKMNETAVDAVRDLTNCMDRNSDAGRASVCVGVVTTLMVIKEVRYVRQASELVNRGTVLLSTAQSRVQTCLLGTAVSAPGRGTVQLEELAECVRERMMEEDSNDNEAESASSVLDI